MLHKRIVLEFVLLQKRQGFAYYYPSPQPSMPPLPLTLPPLPSRYRLPATKHFASVVSSTFPPPPHLHQSIGPSSSRLSSWIQGIYLSATPSPFLLRPPAVTSVVSTSTTTVSRKNRTRLREREGDYALFFRASEAKGQRYRRQSVWRMFYQWRHRGPGEHCGTLFRLRVGLSRREDMLRPHSAASPVPSSQSRILACTHARSTRGVQNGVILHACMA